MDMTAEIKTEIDSQTYKELLRRWRYSPAGDLMFQGESGKYYQARMSELRSLDPEEAVRASKSIGW